MVDQTAANYHFRNFHLKVPENLLTSRNFSKYENVPMAKESQNFCQRWEQRFSALFY